MHKIWITMLYSLVALNSFSQDIIGKKGTILTIDSSKWKLNGNSLYNKNIGNIGIGTKNPTAQLHVNGTFRLEGIGVNSINSQILTSDENGNITTRSIANIFSGNSIVSLNTLTNSIQSLQVGINGTDFNILSSGTVHTFNIPSASALNRGLLSSDDWSNFNNKENSLTFSNGLSRAENVISINTSQNIQSLSNLTTNGLIKTSEGNGKLSIAIVGKDYSAGTSTLGTGILKSNTGTGSFSIADASDFPILNQNTTGNAATVTKNANLTGPITSVGNNTSISNNVIDNNMLVKMPSQSFKGRLTDGIGNVEDLTVEQATEMLKVFTSSTKGLVPASNGDIKKYLRADGVFATPESTSRNMVQLTSNITNNNLVANTLENVTGLFFNVVANNTYRFYIMIPYSSESNNNGSRWTIDGPSNSFISYMSRWTLNTNTETINYCDAINQPAACNNNSRSNGNIAIIQGFITPIIDGVVQVKFASETSRVGIIARAGAILEYW